MGSKQGRFLPAPKKCIRSVLKYINMKKGFYFYDLGAGVGTSVIIAHREFGARARGIEISPILYILAVVNVVAHRVSYKVIRLGSLFKQDLSKAQVVFFF